MGDLNAPVLGSVVLASATSWLVLRLMLGNNPLFHVPQYELVHSLEFAIYGLLGMLGGLALLAGFYSRWAAALLVLVCLGTAFGVHLPAGDQDNMIHFYKNLVMTGGFLYVIAFGPGGLSLDRGAA